MYVLVIVSELVDDLCPPSGIVLDVSNAENENVLLVKSTVVLPGVTCPNDILVVLREKVGYAEPYLQYPDEPER